MSLAPGTRLGPYEIVSMIGAGGMGEVYRARDPKLQRDVALKILPEDFASDPDRLVRFEREARALAALNHPHIAGIYGFEESNGLRALALEFVDGQTLADRITRGPIPLEEASLIGRQITEALEAAHEQGIIHRDLKPTNIKITRDGVVKLLDFGLAKAISAQANSELVENTPTITSASTKLGVVLGTVAYMSPEQARGVPVDRRTDVWAFGCVAFEMLAGSPPFEGSTSSDTLAAVLKGQPPWHKLPGATPTGVVQLLRRCLEKDSGHRMHDIADVRIALEDALAAPPAVLQSTHQPPLAWVLLAVLVGVVLGAVAGAFVQSRQPHSVPEPVTFQLFAPAGTELPPNPETALSPDGRHIVFSATAESRDLWVHSFASGRSIRLPGTGGGSLPFWSADGRAVGFFASGKLKRVDTTGLTAPVELCDVAIGRGGAWNARNEIIFANVDGPLHRVPMTGGSPVPVTRLDAARGDVLHIRPQFLPDGRRILFTSVGKTTEVRIASLDQPADERALALDSVAFYSAGYLVFERGGNLLAQRFDPSTQQLTSDPFTVAQRIGSGISRNLMVQISVTESGVLSYPTYVPRLSRLTWFDRSGQPVGTVGDIGEYRFLSLSHDGMRVAVSKTNQDSADGNIWILEAARPSATPVTFGRQDDSLVRWSPDGQRLVFSSRRETSFNVLMHAPSDASRAPELLLDPTVGIWLNDWSRDGEFIIYGLDSKTTSGDLWILPMTGDRKPRPYLETPAHEGGGAFSFDGQWVAYTSTGSGRSEVYVRSFPGAASPSQISTNGGSNPMWREDGRELFFVGRDQMLMSAEFQKQGLFDGPMLKKLFRLPVPSDRWQQFAVTPDGSRFLAIVPEPRTPNSISVVLNWPALENGK